MWIWIIGGVIVCCVISALAQSEKEEEEKKVSAKRPDAFIRLFSEEFPEYSGHLTFSKSEAAISAWETAIESQDFKKHLKLFSKNEFKDGNSGHIAMTYAATSVAKQISPEFLDFAQKNPEFSYTAIRRAIVSSLTLANQ